MEDDLGRPTRRTEAYDASYLEEEFFEALKPR